MDSDVSDDYEPSDVELDDDTHQKLIDNVLNLSRKEHVKKPSRTEPTLAISEYDLVQTKNKVRVSKLAKVLKNKTTKSKVLDTLSKLSKHSQTIIKPLEKPEAERIRRSIAYTNTQEELKKWDPIVTSLKAANTLTFPLTTDIEIKDQPISSQWRLKSDLQKKLDEIDPPVEVFKINTEPDQFPLTLKEMKEKRMEAAKMRAEQSYREAKAHRQKKIKSKTFHRIQKREKVKKQLQDFELLQKTDPEAALMKLDEIEKARALERVSLRHKSTGKWAQNKQIRAKYDRESRQVLAQQLAISRDLTQKVKNTNSDSEGEEENVLAVMNKDPSNPWTNPNIKVSSEVDQFVSGYRRYWEQKNDEMKDDKEENKVVGEVNGVEIGEKNGDINEEDKGELKKEIKKISFKKVKGKLKEIKVVDPELAPSCPKEKKENDMEKHISSNNIGGKQNKVKSKLSENKVVGSDSAASCPKVNNKKDLGKPSIVNNIAGKQNKKVQSKLNENKGVAPNLATSPKEKSKKNLEKPSSVNNNTEKQNKKVQSKLNENKIIAPNVATSPKEKSEKYLENSSTVNNIVAKQNKNLKRKLNEHEVVDLAPSCPQEKRKKVLEQPKGKKKIAKKKEDKIKGLGTTEWEVKNLSLEQEFAKVYENINQKLQDKLSKVKELLIDDPEDPEHPKSGKLEKDIDLNLYVEAKRPIIDEPLSETDYKNKNPPNLLAKKPKSQTPKLQTPAVDDIDPKKFIAPKTVTLNSQIPDLISYEEIEPEGEQQAMIAEAFADDDIVEDFHKDKQSEMEKSKINERDLSLPGWGSWAGAEKKTVPAGKQRRFLTRAPKYFPRKDQNKGNLILNDANKEKYKQHLVDEVPFPFTRVMDYEASIRLPIGNTFVPEKAHRKLIQPKVRTQIGAIIKPMDQDYLLKVAKTTTTEQ